MSEQPVASTSTLPAANIIEAASDHESDDEFGLGLDELLPVCPESQAVLTVTGTGITAYTAFHFFNLSTSQISYH